MARSFKHYVNLDVVLFLHEGDVGRWIRRTHKDH